MTRFIKNVSLFALVFMAGSAVLLIGTSALKRSLIDFSVPPDKTVLFVGDSRVECAVNDEILTNAINFAQSGSGYFYTYLKVREMLESNSQIKTVVVGYAYGDMRKGRDEWYRGDEKIMFKMPAHLFMFDRDDFFSMLKSNPLSVMVHLHRATLNEILFLISGQGLSRLGGYLYLDRDKIEESQFQLAALEEHHYDGVSRYQEKYLIKTYEVILAHGAEMILLHPPIHPVRDDLFAGYRTPYYSFAARKCPEARIVNHAGFRLPENSYGDLGHLNGRGAVIYSEFLREKGVVGFTASDSGL